MTLRYLEGGSWARIDEGPKHRADLTPVTAAVVSTPKKVDLDRSRETREVSEAWDVWRRVGEIHYVTTQQARLVSRLKWRVTVGGTELEDDDVTQVLDIGFGGTLRELTDTMAIHLQVAGGYVLVRTRPNDNESWKVLPYPVQHKHRRTVEDSDVVVMVFNPDPADEKRPDSPVLAALDIARELILARAQSRAGARSRTAQLNTVLYPLEGAGADREQFEADLMDVITAPLADERTTASVVPNLIGQPAEIIDKWKTLKLSGDIDEKLHERIQTLINQLALVLDCPPEILTGLAEVNHWTGWLLQEDNWLNHVEPLADPIGMSLARALSRAMDGEDGEIVIEPDPAPLLRRRPTMADALNAHTAGLVNDEWTREQLGASDIDAPETPSVDAAVQMAIDLARTAPSLLQQPGLPVIVEQIRAMLEGRAAPTVEVAPDIAGDEVAAAPTPRAVESPAAAEPVAAAASREPSGRALADIDRQAYDALGDLITDTADRTLERLGAKVRSIAQGQKIDLPLSVPNERLAIEYTGEIPNADATIIDTIDKATPRLDRVVERAYSRVRTEGVAISPDPADVEDARALFVSLTTDVVRRRLDGATGVAETWEASRRVVAVAGGNGDTAIVAAPVKVTGVGIALGKRSFDFILTEYQLVPGAYTWVHAYEGPNPHPEHRHLNGRAFNGDYLLDNGINWYPGDHNGCKCFGVPEFERTGR